MRGTIRKLKRKEPTWEVRVDLPVGVDGKRRMKSVSVRGTKRDADMRLRALLSSLDKGLSLDSSKGTTSQFLDWWLQNYVLPKVRPRTSERYASDIRLHIAPVIGGTRLANLRADDAQTVLSTMLDKGYSRKSVRHCYRVMRMAFKHAVEKGIVQVNVTDSVNPPKLEPTELELPRLEQVQHILELAASTPYAPVLNFLIRTGCRRGEALGLEWRHVDLEHGTVSIVQSLQRIGRTGLRFVPPKSAKSRRSVALDEDTVEMLRAHHGGQILVMAQLGTTYEDNGLVFPGPIGKPLDPATLTRNFEKLVKRTMMGRFRLHDLRHFHASMLLKAGVHLKVVQERLGHSSIAITADTYSHVAPSLQKEAADVFSRYMQKM